VVTGVLLDRELVSSYQLLITCTDAAASSDVTPLTGSATLSVLVDDLNDHAPVFRSRDYFARVAENQPSGTPVIAVQAVDRDIGHNAEVRYRLLSADSRRDFRLNVRSGLLTTNREFDREREEMFNVTVVAMDLGNPSLSSTAIVVVSILDDDDQARKTPHADNNRKLMPFVTRCYKIEIKLFYMNCVNTSTVYSFWRKCF